MPNPIQVREPLRAPSRKSRWGLRGIQLLPAAVLLGLSLLLWHRPPPTRTSDPWPEIDRTLLTQLDGKLQLDGKPFTGWMVEHDAGGVLRSRSSISNGVLHGVSEGWFTNGVLEVREHFAKGVSHGARIRWNEQGRKVSETQVVHGKIAGKFRRWHDNGNLAEELTLENGEPEGLSRAWYPSGFLKTEVMVSQGNVLERRTYADGAHADLTQPLDNSLAKAVPPR